MENRKLKELFDSFLESYREDVKDEIWRSQSAKFVNFWNNRILSSKTQELYDQEIDEIVRILDKHGKGNTKESESIGRVMIPQGAWRRLFNQLKEDKELSNAIDVVFKGGIKSNEIAKSIDYLFELNKGNKNNLTGKSATAINCLLAAYNPFENLSIVSLNDRRKLIQCLGIDYKDEANSIGGQIVDTSKLINSFFKNALINFNARTISVFVYSNTFKNLWKTKEREDVGIDDEDSFLPELSNQADFIFYMEKQLEDFLIENWDKTELGGKYDLITNEDGLASQQYRTGIGVIDILAVDKSDGRYVIIELKKNQTSDDTIGQVARYMGWVEEHLSKGKPSKGIIIAGMFDEKLKYAMRKINDVEVYLYKVDFQLKEY